MNTQQGKDGSFQHTTPWRRMAFLKLKTYRKTLILSLVILVQFYLFFPIPPWIPDKHELKTLTGMPTFKKYLAGRSSGVHFKVDGVLLHCSFSAMAMGGEGCDHYEDVLEKDKPAVATWFWMRTRYGVGVRMLDSIEQNGIVRVTQVDTYKRRLPSQKTTIFYNLLLLVILGVAFRKDWQDNQPLINGEQQHG